MKVHTNGFKTQIALAGRELDDKITYTLNGQNITLTSDDLNSVVPNYEGNILKSVMKQIDIDSNVSIPKKTIINYKMGLKVGNSYEYLDFGNYIVFSCDKSEDTNSYNIVAYDKLLYSMTDYEDLNITYPVTVRNYIKALCNKIGLTFANENDIFVNYNKTLDKELYLDLDYKYRDVFDELAATTASTICINSNDELEIRYITETNDVIDEDYFKDVNVQFGEKYGPLNSVVLSRSAESDNIYLQDEDSIAQNGLCEIKIIDNQIMNWDNRDEFLPEILERLNGLEYYINDFSSKGICYYDLCDRYTAKIGEKNYSCIMLNDEVNRRDGLEENIFTEPLTESVTDYSKADKTDRRINKTILEVDKQNQTIKGIIENVDGNNKKLTKIEQDMKSISTTVSETEKTVNATVEKFRVNLETNNLIISVDDSNAPHVTANYDIKYEVYFMGEKITLQPTTSDTHTGITVTKTNDYIRFAVNKNTEIPILDNKYTFKFTYTKDDETYELTKSIIVSLVLQGQKGDTGATGQAGQDGINGTNGTDGVNQYVHIKYSNDGKTFTDNNGETVGTYMGTLIDTYPEASTVFSNYTWKKIATELTAEASGTLLNLPELPNPSYNPIEFKIYGKSEQEVTTNSPSPQYPSEIKNLPFIKNYFNASLYEEIPSNYNPYNDIALIDNGIKVQCKQAGVYRYTRIPIKNFDKLLGKTLILNAKYKSSGLNDPLIRLFWGKADYGLLNQIVEYKPQNEVNKTFQLPTTIPTNATYLFMLIYSTADVTASVGDYIEYTDIMLSDSYSKYIPYGNYIGINKYGKNLLKVVPYVTDYSYGLTITSNTDESLHITGTVTNNWANITKSTICYISPGEYVLSRNGLQNKCTINVRFTFEDNTTQDVTIPKNDTKKTFTLNKKTIHCYVFISGMASNTTFNDNLSIQLEKGSISEEYETYKEDSTFINLEDNELCSISDVKDELVISNGKSIINKKIGKIVLDGTENWYVDNNTTYTLDNAINGKTFSSVSNIMAKCTHFTWGHGNTSSVAPGSFWYNYAGKNLRFQKEETANLTNWKSFLAQEYSNGTPVTVYYIKNIVEPITLNDINIKLSQLTKNISNNYNSEMYLKYWTNAKGNQGTNGKDGKESAVQSATAPEDTTLMWLDTTTNQLKRYNGEEWEVVNDFSGDVDSINSTINNLSSSMNSQLNDLNSKIIELQTELESKYTQTNSSFDWRINTLMTQINQKTGELEQKVLEQSEYMRFESGVGLVIGKTTSPYTLVSKENGIEIRYNGVPISFWNGNTFSVTRLLLGKFAFTPRDNGSLDFGKVVD